MDLDIRAVRDEITPQLEQIGRTFSTRRILAAAGKTLEVALTEHFRALDARGNSRGWFRSHFWSRRVADKTLLSFVGQKRAVVTIDSPEYVHKLNGGWVRPGEGKRALAIPATSQAKAAGSPREAAVQQLRFVPLKTGNPDLAGMLVRTMRSDIQTRQISGGDVWYWLLRRVYHRADPAAQPPWQRIEPRVDAAAQQAARDQLPR
jgi:hypothetical protein